MSVRRSRVRPHKSDIRLTHIREAFVHRGFRATSDDASRMSSMLCRGARSTAPPGTPAQRSATWGPSLEPVAHSRAAIDDDGSSRHERENDEDAAPQAPSLRQGMGALEARHRLMAVIEAGAHRRFRIVFVASSGVRLHDMPAEPASTWTFPWKINGDDVQLLIRDRIESSGGYPQHLGLEVQVDLSAADLGEAFRHASSLALIHLELIATIGRGPTGSLEHVLGYESHQARWSASSTRCTVR